MPGWVTSKTIKMVSSFTDTLTMEKKKKKGSLFICSSLKAYLQGFIGLLDVLDLHFGSAYKKINQCEGKEGNRMESDLDVLLLF